MRMAHSRSLLRIAPDDPRLSVDGFVNRGLDGTDFNRWFGDTALDAYGPAASFSGGVRVRWRTDATKATVHVRYAPCSEECVVNLDWTCYRGGNTCAQACRLSLIVDGHVVDAPGLVEDEVWEEGGEHNLKLPPQGVGVHDYMLVWPSSADIDFLGLTLGNDQADAQTAALLQPLAKPRAELRYVAHGDSITQGLLRGGRFVSGAACPARGLAPSEHGDSGAPSS